MKAKKPKPEGPSGATASASRTKLAWLPDKAILKWWLIFLVVLGVLTTIQQLFADWINSHTTAWTATLTAAILNLLGVNAHAQGPLVVSTIYVMEVIGECTGIFPISIFLAAVIAYPCRWKWRGWGLAFGVPALLLLNQARLVSLCYIGHWYPSIFQTAHVLVWQSLIIFLTVLAWLLWVALLPSDDAARTA